MNFSMKYINKLILENFQSHKYTEIEFDSTLNVIVGPSDQGKSAIIRALKWALYNEPSGDFFIREGERDCSVTVIFNDNTKVKRFRSKSKNAYYLYDANNTEKVFEGFGTTVPQEIIDATSIRKVVLDSDQSSTINIGEQLEGPFLLSEKNSTRANAIGRLVGVHIVDDALKDTLKDIRNLNIKRKSYEDTLKDLYKNLEEYEYLDELTNKIKELDNVKQSIYCCQDKLAKLKSIQVELERLNGEIKLVEDYLTKLKDINKITALEQLLSENIKKYIYISNRYDKFNKIKTEIEHDKYLLKALKDINMVGEIINDINLYNNKINKLSRINNNYNYIINNTLKNKKLLTRLKPINKVGQNIDLIKDQILKINKLLDLKDRLDKVNKNLSIGIVYTNKLTHIEEVIDIQNSLEEKNDLLMKLINHRERYEGIDKERLDVKRKVSNIDKQINENADEYKKILTKIEVCPLCFSPINRLKIEDIIDNYK